MSRFIHNTSVRCGEETEAYLRTRHKAALVVIAAFATTIFLLVHYTSENNAYGNVINNLALIILMLMLLTLVLTQRFIFHPMLERVRNSQEELIELSRVKSDFIANMSHELRTPMNAIFGLSELILESHLEKSQELRMHRLVQSADMLMHIIDDILDFSRIEAGRLALDEVEFSLEGIIDDVAQILSAAARDKGLEIILRAEDHVPRYVIGDPGRVRQIVLNLLSNALKFTDKGYVRIHIDAGSKVEGSDKRSFYITVEDTGIGISQEKFDKIFAFFSQADTSSTRRFGGLGLGLTIADQLTRLMNGRIELESAPGRGSKFRIMLQLRASERTEHFRGPEHRILNGLTALIVDDIEANRLLLRELLHAAGMEVVVTSSGQEALAQLSMRPVDIVVSDYLMPEMDGEALTRAIHDRITAPPPIVILSSAGESGYAPLFARAGVAAYLSKPVRSQRLYETLTMVWRQHTDDPVHEQIITPQEVDDSRYDALNKISRPLEGMHLLLVEDNRVNREFTSDMLLSFGCTLDTAEDGEQAVTCTQQTAYDLILMDCQMPVMDGFTATREIIAQSDRLQRDCPPVIALTANAMQGDKERCLKCGMSDYMTKPVRKARLQQMLFKWLGDKAMASNPQTHITQEDIMMTDDTPVLDRDAIEEARDVLGDKFTIILGYYLEDSKKYIQQMGHGIADGEMDAVIAAAHTLKSSSQQYGVMQVYELSRQMEEALRENGATDSLHQWFETLKQTFARAEPPLRALLNGSE